MRGRRRLSTARSGPAGVGRAQRQALFFTGVAGGVFVAGAAWVSFDPEPDPESDPDPDPDPESDPPAEPEEDEAAAPEDSEEAPAVAGSLVAPAFLPESLLSFL